MSKRNTISFNNITFKSIKPMNKKIETYGKTNIWRRDRDGKMKTKREREE
jgi:hypothetical protein